jgi:hypothetical protein
LSTPSTNTPSSLSWPKARRQIRDLDDLSEEGSGISPTCSQHAANTLATGVA